MKFGPKLNRQPGPIKEDALQMLRDKNLAKFSEVITADGETIGNVVYLLLRQDEVNVELKNYAAYLYLANLKMGTHFYIPTDFIQTYDPEAGQVLLSVPFSAVQDESWNREPTFVAGHQMVKEALSGKAAAQG